METNCIFDVLSATEIEEFRSSPVQVDWANPDLAKIVRLRLISDQDFPFWDLSYCYGVLKDGTKCRVQVPFFQLPKNDLRGAIIRDAKRDGVFAKGLGIFEAISLCQ